MRSGEPTSSSPRLAAADSVRREILIAWLRKARKRRRTLSTC